MRKFFVRLFTVLAALFGVLWLALGEIQTMMWMPDTLREIAAFLGSPLHASAFMVACLVAIFILIRHRDGISIVLTSRNTGSCIQFRVTNHSDKDQRLLSVKMQVEDYGKKITQADRVYKRERFNGFPHTMPTRSSIDISYRYSINGFISFNWTKPKRSNLRVKKFWLEIELEDGTTISGGSYRIPKVKYKQSSPGEPYEPSENNPTQLESDRFIVLEAFYGAGSSWVNVTSGVRQQVASQSGVVIASTLQLGVTDPAKGAPKTLVIGYQIAGRMKEAIVPENGTFNILTPSSDSTNRIAEIKAEMESINAQEKAKKRAS